MRIVKILIALPMIVWIKEFGERQVCVGCHEKGNSS